MNPGFHLSCDENLSKGWGPPLLDRLGRTLAHLNQLPPPEGAV